MKYLKKNKAKSIFEFQDHQTQREKKKKLLIFTLSKLRILTQSS